MQFYPIKTVVRQSGQNGIPINNAPLTPNIYISILVDVAYVIGQQGKSITEGIYIVDNTFGNGSSGEGTMEITTVGSVGQLVAWNVFAIDPNLANQQIEITFIQICTGNVFGGAPIKIDGGTYTWLAQLMYAGKQSYAIQIKITEGLTPVSYFINWNANIEAT